MTSKKSAVKKKKSSVKATKVVLPEMAPVRDLILGGAPLLREALICAVDEPRRWAKTGMAMSALPRFSKLAALLCGGSKCFFCGGKQEPVAQDKLLELHPEYPLCTCLVKFRKVAFDYVEGWDSPEGKKSILDLVDAGKLAQDAPIYQYFCQCGEGPVVVDARTVAAGLRKFKKHVRRKKCNGCHQKDMARWAQQSGKPAAHDVIARPKSGPGAKINKIKHAKDKNKGPVEKSLPPLDALEKKAPEAPATA